MHRSNDRTSDPGLPDPRGQDWLVLTDAVGSPRLAFQQVLHLPAASWPEGSRPQMLHLDLTVGSLSDLHAQHRRAIDLGARLLRDRADDTDEPLLVYADPAGHPFCIFVAG